MSDDQKITAFVANVFLHGDHEPITYDDAFIAINEWIREGMELPEGITARKLADEYNQMLDHERSRTMNTNHDAETIIRTARAECLRGMECGNQDAKLAWYYTHCGEMEMAANLGAITIERMNALESEWREHKPFLGGYPERHRDLSWTADDARAYDMYGIVISAMKLLKMARPERRLGITYIKPDAEAIERFTEWQRRRNCILEGNEYFLVWDYAPDWDTDEPDLRYAVNVSADSLLTAAWELFELLSKKF